MSNKAFHRFVQEFARQPLSGPEAKPCLARLTDRGWDSNFRFSVSLPPRDTLGNWSGRIGFSPSTFSREIDEEGRLDEVGLSPRSRRRTFCFRSDACSGFGEGEIRSADRENSALGVAIGGMHGRVSRMNEGAGRRAAGSASNASVWGHASSRFRHGHYLR